MCLGLRKLSLAVYHDDIIGVTVLSVIVTKSHLVFTQWDKEMILLENSFEPKND